MHHCSQIYIHSKHMQHNEWGKKQGYKWENYRIPNQVFDVVRTQYHNNNRRNNCDYRHKSELDSIILGRNLLAEFKAVFRICVSNQFRGELLFAQ